MDMFIAFLLLKKMMEHISLKLLSKVVYIKGGSKMANSKFIDEPIDEEERALMEAIENGETVPLPQEEEDRIRADIMSASAKNITIRMQLDDLNGIKKMAKAAGMPYQTLINSIIHRYVTGGIVFKVAV
jgi:predicted DNA binding CopG/RHH family protein